MDENKDVFDEENVIRWLNGDLSPDEQRELEADPARHERLEVYRHIWEKSLDLKPHQGHTVDRRLEELHTRLDQPSRRSKFFVSAMRYAAVVTLIIVAGVTLYVRRDRSDNHYIKSAYGEIKTVELPDHSVVTLNGGSSLSYYAASWHEQRRVKLSGEAYFDVKHVGTPFVVEDEKALVKVLGTTFSIRSLGNSTQVACLTGKVEVRNLHDAAHSLILTSGNGTRVSGNEKMAVHAIEPGEVAGWKDHKLYFNNTPLNEVFIELERYFGKKIILPKDVPVVKFTGRFENPEWENVMKSICLSAGFSYTMQNDSTVTIY